MIAAIAFAAVLAAGQGGQGKSDDDSVSQSAKPVLPPDAARPRQDGRNPEQAERIRSNANGQARKPGAKRNFERKADAPAQMNRHPKPMGSGAPSIPVDQQPPVRGKNYGRASSRGHAGGTASDEDNPSGAATEGSAGKSGRTQPPDREHR